MVKIHTSRVIHPTFSATDMLFKGLPQLFIPLAVFLGPFFSLFFIIFIILSRCFFVHLFAFLGVFVRHTKILLDECENCVIFIPSGNSTLLPLAQQTMQRLTR